VRICAEVTRHGHRPHQQRCAVLAWGLAGHAADNKVGLSPGALGIVAARADGASHRSAPRAFPGKAQERVPECDRAILARPEVARISAENAAQALSSGEMAREMVLLRADWGFAVSDLSVPTVLWHGELDRNVPSAHGRRLAAALPHCCATFLPNEGHYVVFDEWPEILASVAADRYWRDDRRHREN
jgi:pimeloyl-ACP methyl ester carboxylesterase